MPNPTPGELAYTVYHQHSGQEHMLGLWPMLPTYTRAAWEAAAQAVLADVHDALALAVQYGQIDGDHHKAWVIDQMCRALLGSPEAYTQFVAEACAGDDGPYTYDWNEGIAP